jgi:GDP-L-fucose synthase
MKTILVTGGSGLVGHGVRAAAERFDGLDKYRIFYASSADCDLRDYDQTFSFFRKFAPTYVVHLAARVGGLFRNMSQKVDMFLDNTAINNNVLRACHELGVRRVVSCLSTCVFPDKTTYPIDETMLHDGPPHASNDAYAYAKRMLEILGRAYNEQSETTEFVCVIPTNIYGPHDNFHLEDSHVVPGLIHRCHLAVARDEPFVVAGTGRPLRQFIHSEDLGRLILWSLLRYESTEPIILAPSEEVSIRWIAETVARLMGYKKAIVYDYDRPDGQYKKTADNTRLMSLLPPDERRFTALEDGLRETVRWFVENYEKARK